MAAEAPDVVLPALLRAARGSYAHAVRRELLAAGFDDLPRNAPFVLGGMVNQHGNPADLIRQLGVTKQAASQLVDVLVERGYLRREPDPADGRRISLAVTDRGRRAAAAVRAGVGWVDGRLAERLSADQVAGLRAGLVALCDIRDTFER